MNPFATVLIVTRGRRTLLTECLRSIQRCRRPAPIELLLVANGEESLAENDLAVLGLDFPVLVLNCAAMTPAAARNIALPRARGNFICFLDDDTVLPADYFEIALSWIQRHPEVEVMGGPDATLPGAGLIERSIGHALASPFATSKTRRRHGGGGSPRASGASSGHQARETDLILCNLWFVRAIFADHGHRFDERFLRNEENVLLFTLKNRVVRFVPDLHVYHRRKTNLPSFLRAVATSGFCRAKGIFLYPGSGGIVFFAPAASLFYLVLLSIFPRVVFALPVLVHALMIFLWSCYRAAGVKEFRVIPFVFFYQGAIVLAYGAGFSWGILMSLPASLRADSVRFESEKS